MSYTLDRRQQDIKDTSLFISMMFPAYATSCYLSLSKHTRWLKSIDPNTLHLFSIVHNFGLHMFSLYTFITLFGTMLQVGIVNKPGYYFELPGVRNMLWLFYLSKYYEYMDTVLLLAKGKKPIFLQKFHHCGAVIVWHLGYVFSMDGLFFASLINSGVHTIMYFYYLMSLYSNIRNVIKGYKFYITTAQVGQLAFGFFALPYFYYANESLVNKNVIIVFDVYIGSLLLLFSKFMVDNYIT